MSSIGSTQGNVKTLEGPGYNDNGKERIQKIIEDNGFEYRRDLLECFKKYIEAGQNDKLEALVSCNAFWKFDIYDIKRGLYIAVDRNNIDAIQIIWLSKRREEISASSSAYARAIASESNADTRQALRTLMGESRYLEEGYIAAVRYGNSEARREIQINKLSNATFGRALKEAAEKNDTIVLQEILGNTENLPNDYLVGPYIIAAEKGSVDFMERIMERPGFIDEIPIAQNPKDPEEYKTYIPMYDGSLEPIGVFFRHYEDGLSEALLAATYYKQEDALQLILECERADEFSPAYIKLALKYAKGNCSQLLKDRFPNIRNCVIL